MGQRFSEMGRRGDKKPVRGSQRKWMWRRGGRAGVGVGNPGISMLFARKQELRERGASKAQQE